MPLPDYVLKAKSPLPDYVKKQIPTSGRPVAQGLGGVLQEATKPKNLKAMAVLASDMMPVAGAIAGGVVAAPANIIAPGVAEAAGTAGGYMLGRQARGLVKKAFGEEDLQSPQEMVKTVGADASEGLKMGLLGPIIPAAASKVAQGIGYVAKPLLGRLTGAGRGAIDEAIKSGAATAGNPLKTQTMFDRALRGKISGDEVVGSAREALNVVKDARAMAYQQKLADISKNMAQIDAAPARNEIFSLLKSYGVKVGPRGAIDTSRIAMGKTGRNDIQDVLKTMSSWGSKPGDMTPIGLDTLKRQLDDFYSDSSQARAFVSSMRNIVKNLITKEVPEYATMTKDYAEATKLIKDVESGLMLRKQGMSGRIVADQTLRRLTSSMKDNFELRKELVSVLSVQGGKDLEGQIAGYTMRSPIPIGLAGTGPALIGEAAIAKLVSPKFWPVLAASSPRLVAEFLRLYGRATVETPGGAEALGKSLVYTIMDSERKKKPNEPLPTP